MSREEAGEMGRAPSDSAEIVQVLLQSGLAEFLNNIPVDLMLWQRFCAGWDAGSVARLETACKATWGNPGIITDTTLAASTGAFSATSSTTVALAAKLGANRDLRGSPRDRFERDQLLISHTAHSLARRVIEPVVVSIIAEGWSEVLANETFALRSPMQYVSEIEAAIKDVPTVGIKAAARLLLVAAPAVNVPLSPGWEQLLRQIAS
jgi:hypothetical protein